MSRLTIQQQIGNSSIDHAAYKVQPGKMGLVYELFLKELGWQSVPVRTRNEDWGRILFVHPDGTGVPFQFTEIFGSEKETFGTVHPAIKVSSLEVAIKAFQNWAEGKDLTFEFEYEGTTLAFISLSDIFAQKIELVEQATS